MEAIALALIGKVENVAILVLIVCLIGCGYLHVVWRREDREDRRAAFETIGKITEALNGVRNTISAITGKELH